MFFACDVHVRVSPNFLRLRRIPFVSYKIDTTCEKAIHVGKGQTTKKSIDFMFLTLYIFLSFNKKLNSLQIDFVHL